jgi:acylphosphatase
MNTMHQSRSVKGFASGRVQGVGFRYFVMRHAQAERLSGYVRNLNDGRVEFFLQGDADSVSRVLGQIRVGPDYSQVSALQLSDTDEFPGLNEFVIRR